MNNVIIVGRLVRDPEMKKLETGKKVCTMTLAVQRQYKNVDGEYETDFIDCDLWEGIAEATKEYCKKGDVVGVKGRLQTRATENGKIMIVCAEKVTFLSSKKENENE